MPWGFIPPRERIKNLILNSIVKEFPLLPFPLVPTLSPVCGGEGKGEGAYLEGHFLFLALTTFLKGGVEVERKLKSLTF